MELKAFPDGGRHRVPTDDVKDIGLSTVKCTWQSGLYYSVLYSSSAQQFIFDNIGVLAELNDE